MIHSFNLKDYIEKKNLGIKSPKISMNFIELEGYIGIRGGGSYGPMTDRGIGLEPEVYLHNHT